eukprot:INCI3474.1.p1 GENE.INCI3474.1~~INCI3474.1.p1  ORF type:complete len:132 (-),score=23.85 INCI3474.1:391-786(-)
MPRMMHLTLAAVVAAASTSSMLACDVGERQEVSCGANSVCCKYQNYVEPSMTLWSCFKGTDNITASSICRRANGTVVGSGGQCAQGSLNHTTCSDSSASCCCSYSQSNPSGEIDATVCTSSTLCGILGGSC